MPPDASPASPSPRPAPHMLFHRRQVIRIAAATAATAFAAGYIVSEIATDAEVLTWLARAGASVAAVTLYSSIIEIRLARQLARAAGLTHQRLAAIERRVSSRLSRAEFAEGYVRGLQRRPPDDGDGRHLRSV